MRVMQGEKLCDGCVCESVFIVNVKGPQCRSHVQDTGACHMKESLGIESRRQARQNVDITVFISLFQFLKISSKWENWRNCPHEEITHRKTLESSSCEHTNLS